MRLRLSIGLLLAGLVLVASPVASGQESASEQKQIVDGRIDALEEKIEAAREREGVLSAEIEVVTRQDRRAPGRRRRRVRAPRPARDRARAPPAQARPPERALRAPDAQARLPAAPAPRGGRAARASGSSRSTPPSARRPLSVVLESGSFSDMLDQLEFLSTIGRQDQRIAAEVESAKLQMQETRNATRRTRRQVAETTRAVAARTAEQRAVRDRLAWSQRELATARRDKRDTLADGAGGQGGGARAHARPAGAERRARRQDPLRSELRRSSRRPPAPPRRRASSGRSTACSRAASAGAGAACTRAIDIAVANGTPVVAAAAGVVIVAGLDGRLRQPRRRRPRRRHRDRVRPQHERHGRRRPAGRPGPADRLLRQHRPLDRPARALRGAHQRRRRSTRSATSRRRS